MGRTKHNITTEVYFNSLLRGPSPVLGLYTSVPRLWYIWNPKEVYNHLRHVLIGIVCKFGPQGRLKGGVEVGKILFY